MIPSVGQAQRVDVGGRESDVQPARPDPRAEGDAHGPGRAVPLPLKPVKVRPVKVLPLGGG
jgi:hypothetical protein